MVMMETLSAVENVDLNFAFLQKKKESYSVHLVEFAANLVMLDLP